ncbi:MAG: tripartite tricarboxylate transporter substrate-binding protein [Candidatus Glassbacteria bacterium]
MAAKAEPDGYTLLLLVTTNAIQPALQKLPYDTLKAFTPIARTSCGTAVLSVHPSVPANSVKEFMALAKKKPGELLFSSSGAGSTAHLQTELFKMMADIDFRIEQFKSAGPAIIELVGGHCNASLGSIASMLPHIKSGRLRALGTSGENRHFALPDVPTIAEAGVPGYSSSSWYGIGTPTGTPAPIIDRLDKEIKTILASAEVQKRFRDRGAEPCYLGTAEFGPFLVQEMAKWGSVVKKANVTSMGN